MAWVGVRSRNVILKPHFKIPFSEVTKESDRQNVIAFCDQNLQHTGLNMLMNNAGQSSVDTA